jgi:hypothetical protein
MTPEDAVRAYTEAFHTWWLSREADNLTYQVKLNARTELCTIAGCPNPGKDHLIRECWIEGFLLQVLHAISDIGRLGRDQSGRLDLAAKGLVNALAAARPTDTRTTTQED